MRSPTLGRLPPAAVLSVDPIEAALWRCGIERSFATGVASYEVATVLAENQLRLGHAVVADAVNSYSATPVGRPAAEPEFERIRLPRRTTKMRTLLSVWRSVPRG